MVNAAVAELAISIKIEGCPDCRYGSVLHYFRILYIRSNGCSVLALRRFPRSSADGALDSEPSGRMAVVIDLQ